MHFSRRLCGAYGKLWLLQTVMSVVGYKRVAYNV